MELGDNMAITVAYTQSAVTIGATEYSLTNNSTTLATKTDTGVFELELDVNNIANGDVYEVRVYEKAASGATQRLAFPVWTLSDAQPCMFRQPLGVLKEGWDVTVKKSSGTDRAFTWSIRQIA